MNAPACQPAEAHQHTKSGGDQVRAMQPDPLRERTQGHQGNGNPDQCIREVERVVAKIQDIIGCLVCQTLKPESIFLF